MKRRSGPLKVKLNREFNNEVERKMKKVVFAIVFLVILFCYPCFHTKAAEIVASGTCGENLTWTLDDEGVLTISGEGEMENYNETTHLPEWSDYLELIQAVKLEEGVTSVGDYAFKNYSSILTISIPKSVALIGADAFRSCTSLQTIDYSAINASIASNYHTPFLDAGINGTGIVLTVADEVEIIPDHIFALSAISEIIWTDSVKSIGKGAFNATWLTDLSIPDSVSSIGQSAFWYCYDLVNLELGNGLTTIGEYAFENCTSLVNLTIPNSVDGIGPFAFLGCESLESIVVGTGVTSIGEGSFRGCNSLSEVYYNAIAAADLNRNSEIFIDSGIPGEGLTVIIGDSVESVPAYLFCNSNITSLTIGQNVKNIGYYAFSACSYLSNILYNTIYTEENYSYLVFSDSGGSVSGITLVIGEDVERIPESLFRYMPNLVEINFNATNISYSFEPFKESGSSESGITIIIGDNVKTIPDYLFHYCVNATNVYIGKGVTSIGNQSFFACSNLSYVYYDAISVEEESIGSIVFFGSGITEAGLRFEIGENVENLSSALFDGADNLRSIEVVEGNPFFSSVDGVLYNKTKKVLIRCPQAYVGEFAFPDSLKVISNNAFKDCINIDELIISEKINTIEEQAFYNCTNLKKITFLGDQPSFGTDCFGKLNCRGYYPYGNSSWEIQPYYGYYNNNLVVEWVPYSLGEAQSISLIRLPDKLVYEKSETVDLSGLEFQVVFSDGLVWTYNCEEVQSVSYDFSSIGTTDVTIYYGNLPLSFGVTVYEIVEVLADPSSYPESEHPYANNIDQTYSYQYSGAFKLALTFSEETKLEDKIDYLYILDSSDNVIGTYTGTQLSGQTVEVTGDSVKLRLVSDEDESEYGFSLISIIAYYREGLCEGHHNWADPILTWAEDYKTATATRVCQYDSAHTETIAATVTSLVKVPASCLTKGVTTYSAVAIFSDGVTINESRDIEDIEALGHDWDEGEVTTEPICTVAGVKTFTCRRCGEKRTEEIAALGHIPGEAVKENNVDPTCTEEGHYDEVVYCTVCHEELSRNTVAVEALGHDYEAVVTEPTCTEQGYTTYTCTRCRDSYKADYTEALGHDWDEGEVTTEPTCTEAGVKTFTCHRCGEKRTEEIAALGHTPGEAVKENNVDPTCTEAGHYDEVVYCMVCHEELSRNTVTVEALGHNYEAVVTEPTCTEQGYTTYTCTRCGDSYKADYKDALGHDWDEGEVTTEPTCTEAGVKTFTCRRCGEERTEEIAALGHTPGEAVKEDNVDPTCEEDGHYDMAVYCTVCGKELSREKTTVPALGHKWHFEGFTWEGDDATGYTKAFANYICENDETHAAAPEADLEKKSTDASCTEAGTVVYTASVSAEDALDGEARSESRTVTGAPLGHDYELTGWDWAEDYSTAKALFTCKNDPTHKEEAEATVTPETTAATCEEDGKTVYTATATFEGETYTDTKEVTIPALGHTPGEAVRENNVDPTCTEAGHYDEVVYCTVCGKELSRNTITVEALGHDYEAVVTSPTCTEQGYTTYTCTRCGDSYKADYKDALGHDWDEGEVTTEPTCTEAGVKTFTCRRCGEEWTEEIPALGHKWHFEGFTWEGDDATGYTKVFANYICENDETHKAEPEAGLEKKSTDASCTEAGTVVYTATVSAKDALDGEAHSESRTVTGSPLGHDYELTGWTWAEDNSTAKALFTCKNDPTHKEEAEATVTPETTAATCEEDGKTVYMATATFEGKTYTDTKEVAIPALGHTPGEAVKENNVDPTCTEAGHYDEVIYCTVCHEELSRNTVTVEALGHDWDEGEVTTEPTCTTTGIKTFTCKRCGEERTEEIAALGHKWHFEGFTWEGDDATGYTKVFANYICENDETHKAEPEAGLEKKSTDASCTEAGTVVYTASVSAEDALDGEAHSESRTVTGAPLGHTPGEAVKENNVDPTCTEEGHYDEVVYCTVCHEELSREYKVVPAAGHTWGNVIFTWTGFTAAIATRTCQKDTTHTETVDCVIASEVVEAPTATTEGLRIYTATAKFSDGTIIQNEKEEVIPALGWTWTRLAGDNRYHTAVMAAQEVYEEHSCTTIIIASGQSFPDALSGSALAGVYGCPILLTNKERLSAETKSEIQRLAASDCKVLILGGTGTVSEAVENAIKKLGVKTERVAGTNREATAQAVYEKGKDAGGFHAGGTVILSTGYSFADVLSISPYAYASRTPILLAKKDCSLSKETKLLIQQEGFTRVIIIGGTGSVSEEAENWLKGLGIKVLRLTGLTRYETSAEILKWETGLMPEAVIQPEVLMTLNGMGVATGAGFPDALGSVSLLGKTASPLLLVSDSNKTNRELTKANISELIAPNSSTMTKGYIFGGTGTVSKQIEGWLNEAVK